MKKFILISFFLFSFIFNIVFIYHLVTVHGSSTEKGVLDDVILTEKQRKIISEKSRSILKNNNELNYKLERCRKDLYNILEKKDPDKVEINNCIDAINRIQKEIQINTVEQVLIYKKHLTESQCDCFMKNVGDNMGIPHKCDADCKCSK